jgi:hypothetical protein
MTRLYSAILIFCAVILFSACEKSNHVQPPEPAIKIEGFSLFDYFGNSIGRVGPLDSDWMFINPASLSQVEQSLVNLPDTANTTNTVVTSVLITPFPNPVSSASAIHVNAGDSVKFKLVVTDSTGIVLKQLSKKIKGAAVMQIDVSDRSQFPNRKSLRYYYSFSAASNPNFKVGYGDIKVCDYNAGQQPVTVCFQ